METGEVWRGRIWQPDRGRFRRWLGEELAPRAHGGPVAVAVAGCTGWRYVVEEVSVDCSDRHRAGGYLCRPGPPTLRWALFEAGKSAARAGSPDYDYYQTVKRAHDGKLAAIAMARKIARRCYHTLRAMDPEEVYATTTA